MWQYYLQGFFLGLAYVAPIGMQNLYVINTAVRMSKKRAYQVAFVTIFFDISLALACYFGIGILLENIPALKNTVILIGSGAIIYIGFGLVRSNPSLSVDVDLNESLLKVAATCFAVTWFNPQAIIDGSLLLGGFRASLTKASSTAFIFGVTSASFLWFTSITTIVSIFKNIFNEKILKFVNILCGLIIIFYGIKLGTSLFF